MTARAYPPFTRSRSFISLGWAIALSACSHGSSIKDAAPLRPTASVPETAAVQPAQDWRARGTVAGTISPRLASCPAHCKHQLDGLRPVPADQQAESFAQACFGSCLGQVSEQKQVQCYAAFGAASADEWQALYLERGLLEMMIPCMGDASSATREARSTRELFELEQHAPETVAAVHAERSALRSGALKDALAAAAARRRANESKPWKNVVDAFRTWQASASPDEEMATCFAERQSLCEVALGGE